jgi:hypothetical protein
LKINEIRLCARGAVSLMAAPLLKKHSHAPGLRANCSIFIHAAPRRRLEHAEFRKVRPTYGVMPAKAGIHLFFAVVAHCLEMDSGFRRNDTRKARHKGNSGRHPAQPCQSQQIVTRRLAPATLPGSHCAEKRGPP